MEVTTQMGDLLRQRAGGLFADDPEQGKSPVGVFSPGHGILRALVFPLPLQLFGARAAEEGVVHVLSYLGDGRIQVSKHEPKQLLNGGFWPAVADVPRATRSAYASPHAWMGDFLRSGRWPGYVDAVRRWHAALMPTQPLVDAGLRAALRTLLEAALHRAFSEFETALVDCEDGVAVARYRAMVAVGRRPVRIRVPTTLRNVSDSRARRRLAEAQLHMPGPLLRLASLESPAAEGIRAALLGNCSMTNALKNVGVGTAVAAQIVTAPSEIPPSWSASRFLSVARLATCLEPGVLPDSAEGWLALATSTAAVEKIDAREAMQRQHLRWIYSFGSAAAPARRAALKRIAAGLRSGEFTALPIPRDTVRSIAAAATRLPRSGTNILRRRLHDRWSHMRSEIPRRAAELVIGHPRPEAALDWLMAATPRWLGSSPTTGCIRLRLLDGGNTILEHGRLAGNCLDSPYPAMRYLAHRQLLFAIDTRAGRLLGTMAVRLPAHDRGDPPSITEMTGVANRPLMESIASEVKETFRWTFIEDYDHRDWVPMVRRSRRLARALTRAVSETVETRLSCA